MAISRGNVNDLAAFVAIARERSFTKAAAKLGVSQSALSHTMRGLEERLGLQLLTRTTRSVSPTEAGEQLLATVAPHLDEIDAGLAALTEARTRPAGYFRLTTTEHAADTILWPAIERLAARYPDIGIEVVIDYGWSDIVAERYDAGVRLGEDVEKDMIAVRIGPEVAMAVVAAPAYFVAHGRPDIPQDLVQHRCINLRLKTGGGLYAWEFEKDGRKMNVRVDGKLTFNVPGLIIKAALAGLGVACMLEDQARPYLVDGRLVRVLEGWCPPFPGYHLYYASRRQASPAFRLLVEALRYRE